MLGSCVTDETLSRILYWTKSKSGTKTVAQVNAQRVRNQAMGAGSQFRAMPGLQIVGGTRSTAPRLPGRSLSSVHHVARPLCLPLHFGRHVCAHRGRSQQQTRAVVAAPEKVDTGSVPPFQAWTTGAAIKKREDIKSIMILGAGPIVIGQARCL